MGYPDSIAVHRTARPQRALLRHGLSSPGSLRSLMALRAGVGTGLPLPWRPGLEGIVCSVDAGITFGIVSLHAPSNPLAIHRVLAAEAFNIGRPTGFIGGQGTL